MERIPVLIVGGGPVGLSMAVALAHHGVRCVLVERHPATTNHPKARAINTRTMELFRAWGIDRNVRRAALSQDWWRFGWCETLAGRHIGSVGNPEGETAIYSPVHRRIISQDVVEQILFERAATLEPVQLNFSTQAESIRQNGSGVLATLTDRKTGATKELRADYVIAADGARSRIREQLGIGMEGPEALSYQSSIYFRADLRPWTAHRPADIYYCTAGDWIAVVNGATRWLAIARYDPEAGESREDFTVERCAERIRRSVGIPDLPVDVINSAFWTMGAQVAERFRHSRIFLVGDSAHRMSPTGGFGANTGIQDAHNLAWKIAYVLRGQAGSALLDTYESERKPVARQNADWSASNARRIWSAISAADSGNEEELRDKLADQVNHICSQGLALGFSYDAEACVTSTREYSPSGRPGGRAPHVWLSGGEKRFSTLDLFDRRFVLLTSSESNGWWRAGQEAQRAMPGCLDVAAVGSGGVGEASAAFLESYGLETDGAVLVRPDGHVAWRSRSGSADPAAVVKQAMRRGLTQDAGALCEGRGLSEGR